MADLVPTAAGCSIQADREYLHSVACLCYNKC